MLLDLSFYGFKNAFLKGLKAFGWVVLSAAVGSGGTYLAQQVHDFGVAHPEYILYTGAAVGAINFVLYTAKKWLTSIAPQAQDIPPVQAGEIA